MNLEELYNYKLLKYNLNGIKEQPDKLLAMLLLQKMECYKEVNRKVLLFYRDYKKFIDKNIEKVITDFNLTDEELINYIKINYTEEYKFNKIDFEFDKTWFVFGDGISALQWGLLYKNNENPLDIYCEYFNDYELKNMSKMQKSLKECIEDKLNYKVKQKNNKYLKKL